MNRAAAPESVIGIDPASPGGLIDRAEHLIGVRRYVEALPWLGRAIAVEPQNSRGHCLMALALRSLGEYPRALEAAQRALAANLEDEWPHRLRSIVLLEMGRRRVALQAARESVRLGPDVPEALFTLVQAQLACGKTRDAQATGARLAEIAPDRALTYQTLGYVAIRRRQWAAAEAHLRRALAIDPESYETMNDLGLVLQEQGKAREAIDRFHDALRTSPARREARENLFGALRRFLRPVWVIPAGVVLGAGAQAYPSAQALLPLIFAVVMLAYLYWRRQRLRTLPASIVALSRHERQWWRRRFPSRRAS
jgi:tetratricopeptide (TPR) repeat protein